MVSSWGECKVMPFREIRMSGGIKPCTGLHRLSVRASSGGEVHLALKFQSAQWERSPGINVERSFLSFITQSVMLLHSQYLDIRRRREA